MILILFFFCVLTLASFLPMPVTVILCAALACGLGVTVWFNGNRRAAEVVIKTDAAKNVLEKSRRKSDRL
jgi:Flp pilus assembly protein TadB